MKITLAISIVILSMGLLVGPGFAQNEGVIPEITAEVLGETGEGYIYIANFPIPGQDTPDSPYQNHLLVVDNDGEIVWSQPLERRGSNFRSYPNQTMVYHDLLEPGPGGAGHDGPYIILDANGAEINRVSMQGFPTTIHDFLLLPNGNAMMMAYDDRVMDLSYSGGSLDALVMNVMIQEVTPEGEVAWEWSGWDHFFFEDTAVPSMLTREPPAIVDFVHPNGLALDLDGNILLSSRSLDEITKIDRETGEIIWRLGGLTDPNNEFTFIDDPLNGFTGQHMPVVLENGNLLLFDNGDRHDPPLSRAVEYEIDAEARTATLVWSYDNGQYSRAMGSVQRLTNGNTVIGWGVPHADFVEDPARTTVTEVDAAGEVVFELRLPQTLVSYRAYRLPFYGE